MTDSTRLVILADPKDILTRRMALGQFFLGEKFGTADHPFDGLDWPDFMDVWTKIGEIPRDTAFDENRVGQLVVPEMVIGHRSCSIKYAQQTESAWRYGLFLHMAGVGGVADLKTAVFLTLSDFCLFVNASREPQTQTSL